MSRKPNPTLIGLFIVAAIALAVGAVFLFGSVGIFKHTKKYVAYFDTSLQGLDPGMPVKFRGVTIGRVKDILIHFNQAPGDSTLPVIIELDEDLLTRGTDKSFQLTDDATLETHLQRGLRARLELQSILTGLLYVDLDFLPDTPQQFHQLTPKYKEIPTAPTELRKLLDNIYRIDLAGLAQRLSGVLNKLDARLDELQMKEISRSLTNLLLSIETIVSSPEVTNAIVSAHQTLDEVRALSKDLRSQVNKTANSANDTLAQSSAAIAELRVAVQDARDLIAPHAPLRRELDSTLEQLGDAARSVESLADFLKRHPNALLSGRKDGEPKR
jgi:paraquat-inducible protein B